MKIVATSDLHGQLPLIPPCDLLLIAGDICPDWNHNPDFQIRWLNSRFANWLESVPAKQVVGVYGNHDFVGQHCPEMVADLPWKVLTDEAVTVEGLRIYGLPWQRRFKDWAFNLDEPELDEKYKAITKCDIIVSHGPPYGHGDWVERGENVGSKAFLAQIDKIKPKLVVFGHIHTSPGRWLRGRTTLANVTLMDDRYVPSYSPLEITL